MVQESTIHYEACPSCNSSEIKLVLTAKDYTVSGEEFGIWECGNCTLRFTQDVPGAEVIGPYYQAESYISHTDSRKGIVNQLYHIIRQHTLAKKRRTIQAATGLKQGKLLDIGAGTGAFAGHMKASGWEVTGLEPDEQARAVAAKVNGVNLLPASDLYSLTPDHYDAITLWHVLEHVHDLHPYMGQLARLLKKSGRIFIAVPNYTSHDAEVYKNAWAAYDVPRHLYHFSPDAMEVLLAKHDLQLQVTQPMWFDSTYISMLSEKYKTGHSSLVKAAWTGLRSNMKAFVDKSRCSSLTYVVNKGGKS